MNKVNVKKLLNTKWTAVQPKNKEKHFEVTHVEFNSNDEQRVDYILITAIISKKEYQIDYRDLRDQTLWKQGWK